MTNYLYNGVELPDGDQIHAETGNEITDYSLRTNALVIDYTAMIQGWIVGKRLAAMRGKA